MCPKLTRQVWKLTLPPIEKFVLLSLADHANDEGACWPSQSTLADATGYSERRVKMAIQWLCDNGHISIEKGCTKWNPKLSPNRNTYLLSIGNVVHGNDMHIVHDVPLHGERGAPDIVHDVPLHGERGAPSYIEPTNEPTNRTTNEPPCRPDGDGEKKSKKAKPVPQTRKRDLLFDAIAEVCHLEPAVSGNVIGKCKQTLLKYNPPATPDEVRRFGEVYAVKHPVNQVPTWSQLANQFKLVRDGSVVQRIMAGPRGNDPTLAYRNRIQSTPTSRRLTEEEIQEYAQEEVPF